MTESFKKLLPIIAVIVITVPLIAALSYWAGDRPAATELELLATSTETITTPLAPAVVDTNPINPNPMNPIAVFTTNQGVIEIELFKDIMPTTAGNFEKLVREGFYNNVKFHRVIDGFMIQGGDPLTKDEAAAARWGTGGPGYAIADEFSADPRESNLRGTISMANSGPNTGGSQFFINTNDNLFLDGKHPVFGQVVNGMDVVAMISGTDTNERDVPVTPVVIESATIKE